MPNFSVVTNNPAVASKHGDIADLRETDVAGIFTAVRDAVHGGASLISHPLAGSLKPNESPYKSILVSHPGRALDMEALALIEGAIAVLRKMPVKNRPYPEAVLDDFRVIDLDLVDSALMALPSDYHR